VARFNFNEQIDVAIRAIVSVQDGAKHTDIACARFSGLPFLFSASVSAAPRTAGGTRIISPEPS
jgi:hypothetical protein